MFCHCTYPQFESRPVDAEFVHLMHDLQSTEIVGHKYRGYTLLTQDGSNLRSIKVSMQLNTVFHSVLPWISILFYETACCLHTHPVFSTSSSHTCRLPAYTYTPLSTEAQPTVQLAVDVLSVCGIEQLNWVQLQLEPYNLRWLR
jgi:hypothetical protein